MIETIFRNGKTKVGTTPMDFVSSERIFSLGMAIRADIKGDAELKSSTHTAIEDSVSQVLRCANGFMETLEREKYRLWPMISDVHILPVVITTANLFACNTDLSTSSISTGDLRVELGDLAPVDWLFLNFPMSLSLRHGLHRVQQTVDLPGFHKDEFVRTVAIVSSTGLESFVNELQQFETVEVNEAIRRSLGD